MILLKVSLNKMGMTIIIIIYLLSIRPGYTMVWDSSESVQKTDNTLQVHI